MSHLCFFLGSGHSFKVEVEISVSSTSTVKVVTQSDLIFNERVFFGLCHISRCGSIKTQVYVHVSFNQRISYHIFESSNNINCRFKSTHSLQAFPFDPGFPVVSSRYFNRELSFKYSRCGNTFDALPQVARNVVRFWVTLRYSNIAMENGPFEDVFPIKHRDIPLLC